MSATERSDRDRPRGSPSSHRANSSSSGSSDAAALLSDPFRKLRSDEESMNGGQTTPHAVGPSGISPQASQRGSHSSSAPAPHQHHHHAHPERHRQQHQQQQQQNGDGDDGRESVEVRYDRLKGKVNRRREESTWWLWTSLLFHFALILWSLWLASYVDTGLSCSRPLRGVTVAIVILLIISAISLILTNIHIQATFRRFVSSSNSVVREEVSDDEEAANMIAPNRLTHQQTEMIVSRSITNRIMYGCCSTCTQLLATIVLFCLLITLFLYSVVQSSDCEKLMPTYSAQSGRLCLGVLVIFIIHILVYLRLSYDFSLCYEIHFCEQNLIKEETKIRPSS